MKGTLGAGWVVVVTCLFSACSGTVGEGTDVQAGEVHGDGCSLDTPGSTDDNTADAWSQADAADSTSDHSGSDAADTTADDLGTDATDASEERELLGALPEPVVTGTATVGSETVVLTPDCLSSATVTSGGLVIPLAGNEELSLLHTGSVLVSEGDDGLLVRVTSAEVQEGQIVLTTEAASLEDVFETADIRIEIPLPTEVRKSMASRALKAEETTDETGTWWLDKSFGGDTLVSEDIGGVPIEVTLTDGYYRFQPTYSMEFTIESFTLKTLSFHVGGIYEAGLGLEAKAGGDFQKSWEKQIGLWAGSMIPITVAGVPIPMKPQLDLVLHGEASLTAEASLTGGGSISGTLDGEIQYQDGEATLVDHSTTPVWSVSETKISGKYGASIEVGARLKVSAQFFKFLTATGSLEAGPYAKGSVELVPTCHKALDLGIDGRVSGNLSLFSRLLCDSCQFDKSLFDVSEEAWGKDCCYIDLLAWDEGESKPGEWASCCVPEESTTEWTTDPLVCREMVTVPEGSFWQGCNEAVDADCWSYEYPYHEVNVPEFLIDKYEVTVHAYSACVDAGGCTTPGGGVGNWGVSGREEHPINFINWDQAKTYCAWAGRRLCSESEWEKASRGTDGRKYPWGNEEVTCDYAVMWLDVNEDGGADSSEWGCGTGVPTMEVGSKPAGASPYGAMDMAGNVWEWVEDDWHDNYTDAPTDGDAWVDDPRASFRVIRGGIVDYHYYVVDLRSSFRDYGVPAAYYHYHIGVRCCRSP